MSKRVSIIGKGTAGCITALDMSNSGYEVDWYHDSSISAASVGEGADMEFCRFLNKHTDLNYLLIHFTTIVFEILFLRVF